MPTCEQTFSVMKYNKSKYRSSLTDDYLPAVLHISTSNIQPDLDTLVKSQEARFGALNTTNLKIMDVKM